MAYRDIEKRRRNNLARFHRRNETRRAAGLCLKCGKVPPAPERTLCDPCAEKRRAADRARSARLRAEGKPRRDPAQAKRYERERSSRQHAERRAAGICTKCDRAPARPERTCCEPCAERHRGRDRARHAQAKAEGIPYGGRDPEARRRAGRKRSLRRSVGPPRGRPLHPLRHMSRPRRAGRCASRAATTGGSRNVRVMPNVEPPASASDCATPAPAGKAYCDPCVETRSRRRNLKAKREADRQRYAERRARGDCTSCGKPAHGAAECQACCDTARARYDARRAAGVCVKCRIPTYGGTAYCAPCAVAKAERRDRDAEYAAKRRRYAERRVRGHCVECDAPSPGVARCEPCSRKHRESSGAFRGIPLWDPSWTVIEIATGREHGPYDSEADVALCLAFAKLARDEVEVIADISPMATLTAHPW